MLDVAGSSLKIVKFKPICPNRKAKPAPYIAIGCFEMLQSFGRVLLKVKARAQRIIRSQEQEKRKS